MSAGKGFKPTPASCLLIEGSQTLYESMNSSQELHLSHPQLQLLTIILSPYQSKFIFYKDFLFWISD